MSPPAGTADTTRADRSTPTVLHVFESWRPVISGYTSRSWELIRGQLDLGLARPRILVTSRASVYGLASDAAVPIPAGLTDRDLEIVAPSRAEQRVRRWSPYWLDHRHLARHIAAAGRRHRADLVHVHWSSGIGSAAAVAARRLGLPLVAEVRFDLAGTVTTERLERFPRLGHVVEGHLRTRFERHLAHAHAVVAASDPLAQLLEAKVALPASGITVVPNGVDAALFSPADDAGEARTALRHQLGLDDDTFVVGSTAKMLRYEGLDLLLHAAADIDAGSPPVRIAVLLVGGGPQAAALQAQAATHGVKIVFTGRVAPAEVPSYVRAMDLFCVPRRDVSVTRHGSPIKVLEAMGCGLPVLATPVADLPRFLADGRGFLAPSAAVADLVEALRTAAAAVDARQRMATEARQWVLEHATWRRSVRRYVAVYDRALEAGDRA